MMLDTDNTFTFLTRTPDIEEELSDEAASALWQARSLSAHIFSLISLVVPLVLGIWYGIDTLQKFVIREHYARNGQPIIVTVTACEMIRPEKSRHYALVDFEYTFLETQYTGQQDLYGSSCNPYRAGQQLNALYLPSDASGVRIPQSIGGIDLLGPIAVAVVFCSLSLYVLRGLRKSFRALRETSHRESGPFSDAAHPYDPLPLHVTSFTWWLGMSTCFSIVFFIVIALVFMIVGRIATTDKVTVEQAVAELIGLTAGVIVCFFAGTPLYQRLRRAFYALRNRFYVIDGGIVIEGKITAISHYTLPDTDDYYVRVWYEFIGAGKKPLKGFAESHRQDLKDKTLLSVGTPVTIVYADNNSHMML